MTGEPSAFRAGALGQPPKILLSVDGCHAQVAPWAGMPHPVRPSDEPAGPGRWWRRRRRRTPKPHPAPSPPPQPPPDPLTAWPWPLLYCADTGEAAGCAARAAQSGFRAIALQLGTYSQADVDACRAHGLRILGCGIATTFSGLEQPAGAAEITPYISVTMVECYVQDSPIHAELGLMLRQARQYGLPGPVPVVGLYDDVGTEA